MRHCIACGKELTGESLFQLKAAPASAQDMPDAAHVAEDRGMDLALCRCTGCGLVQFACEPVSYYKDVIRAGGYSTTMTELRRSQYRHLITSYHLEGKKFLEVGCGRGEFLKVLTEFPVQAYGMEHKADLVEEARRQGLFVWQEFPDAPNQVFGGDGPYDVFLSFNFLEHQPHPNVMLQAIRSNLAEGGMGLVTVPSLEYILEQGSYYELIRDHMAYYSFGTLRGLLERNGFAVLEEEMVNRDTVSMIVRKMPAGDVSPADGDHGISALSLSPLTDGYRTVRREIDGMLSELTREGKTLAMWGASHQGFTLAATTALGERAAYIVDSAPFKQGRFAPASHLPIVPPEYFADHPVDAVLIAAPGYTDEIAGLIRQRFGPKVQVMAMRTNRLERLQV